ncbi:MAG: hypothetical protein NTW28_13950 [Candidatus Solibacter sp.]|nr:hypothetical protein [Candidatus Solibacter sp.]
MARAIAILRALALAYRRDWTAFQSLAGNSFFLITAFMLGKAGTFVYLIMGLVVLFPLSTDPLRKIPPSRLALWPLNQRERWILRLLSPWINPLTWGLAALAVWGAGRTLTVGLWAAIAGLFAAVFLISAVPLPSGNGMWRRVPPFPGPLEQLVRKNLREILCTLDFYCALILSAAVLAYRLFGPPFPPEAFMAMTVLVVGAMSSYAQCLFGLDGEGGLSRYRLLPVRGWLLLLAKDAAFLAVVIPLTLPLALLPGIGAALVALAVGHAPAVEHPRPQTRWRFSTGGALGNGAVQLVALAMTASAIFSTSTWFLAPAVAAWAVSVWWYGREVERVLG